MIDWLRVEQLRSDIGDYEFCEIIELFLAESKEAVDRLPQVLEAEQLRAELHFIEGSSYNLGFERLGNLCALGGRLAATGRMNDVDISEIICCYAESRQMFLEWLRKTTLRR